MGLINSNSGLKKKILHGRKISHTQKDVADIVIFDASLKV
jgi:hypothetical protein